MNPSTIRGRTWGLAGVASLLLISSAGVAHALSGWTCYGQSGRAYRCSVGGSPQELYDGSVQHACWSATGKYIYFNKTNGEIWRMGNDGSGPTKLCDGSANDKCPIAT